MLQDAQKILCKTGRMAASCQRATLLNSLLLWPRLQRATARASGWENAAEDLFRAIRPRSAQQVSQEQFFLVRFAPHEDRWLAAQRADCSRKRGCPSLGPPLLPGISH